MIGEWFAESVPFIVIYILLVAFWLNPMSEDIKELSKQVAETQHSCGCEQIK